MVYQLAINRLKSSVSLDEFRVRQDSALANLYLHGKLLYARCWRNGSGNSVGAPGIA